MTDEMNKLVWKLNDLQEQIEDYDIWKPNRKSWPLKELIRQREMVKFQIEELEAKENLSI